MTTDDITKRLEEIRAEIRAERVSYGELAELQDYGARGLIDPSDVELLEWAGVPEFPEEDERRELRTVRLTVREVVDDDHLREIVDAVNALAYVELVQVIDR